MSLDRAYSEATVSNESHIAQATDETAVAASSTIAPGGATAAEDAFAAPAIDAYSATSARQLDSLTQEREASLAQEIAVREQKVAQLERAFRAALRDRELSAALAGKPLLPGAAAQLVKLWRDDVEVVDKDGEYQVFTRDGRSLSHAVETWLASPEYAHFCQPSSRGGTASRGTNRPATPGASRSTPKNLGEAVVLRWQEALARASQETLPSIKMGRRR